jgi:hypothetical protein
MYVRGYLQGSENGRVVTIVCMEAAIFVVFHSENCLKYNFIKLSCNWHVKSSAIYTPNAYEVICRVARMAE